MAETNLVEALLNLKEQLQQGQVAWKDALDQVEKLTAGYRSWQTPYWKAKREEILQNACVQCGATGGETTLVLQHFWHPPLFRELREIAYERYKQTHPFSEAEANEIEAAVAVEVFPTRNACPQCTSINLRLRKKDGKWICGKCHTEFDEPASVTDPDAKRKFEDELWLVKGKARYQAFVADDNWQRPLVLEVINGSLRYLSFKDTATFCKKCAFLWDEKRMKICPKCRKNYIRFEYDLCRDCQFDAETGIFTLSLNQARHWFHRSDVNTECQDLVQEQGVMAFFACVLKQQGLEVIEIQPELLFVRAEQAAVWEALSGRKSFF